MMPTLQLSAYDAPRCSSGKVMTPVRSATPSDLRSGLMFVVASLLLLGCGTTPAPKPEQPVAAKPAEPAVSAELQAAGDALLGTDTKVLASGDLAKTGKQQILAANVVAKTPKDNITGTIVTRAVIAQNEDGKWAEIFRCDEHLKNAKGYLGMTPIEPVSGWRLQFEQDAAKGLTLYLTPVTGMEDKHVLPIGVRWNPKTKRYQSLDRTYEQFLMESPSLSNSRSQLR
jgi:hypothetical protein